GDIAEIDHEGYVMIYDRRKDLIISGGENIYPSQIVTAGEQFPGVRPSPLHIFEPPRIRLISYAVICLKKTSNTINAHRF
ncbi:hypothetical protein Q2316_25390, partial [Escherichia coli]|nr:hypothetical protein [Escherichia coli]